MLYKISKKYRGGHGNLSLWKSCKTNSKIFAMINEVGNVKIHNPLKVSKTEVQGGQWFLTSSLIELNTGEIHMESRDFRYIHSSNVDLSTYTYIHLSRKYDSIHVLFNSLSNNTERCIVINNDVTYFKSVIELMDDVSLKEYEMYKKRYGDTPLYSIDVVLSILKHQDHRHRLMFKNS